ncbi:MAG: hypothetical protein QF546_06205, partial [Alphaproteobacteria bacterium]|nr:hypothetical protein [Alphaproteobacteria bacterium]
KCLCRVPQYAPLAQRITAHQAFYAINRSYFEEDVFRGQMVGHNDSLGFFADGASDPFYSTELDDLGGPPAGRGNAGGFETLHPRFAEAVIARTFAALEEVGPFNDEVSFLQVLAIVDFLLQVAHFAKDGSGRSGEDLLVLLGLRHGAPLTFSVTGYRGAIEGPERLMSLRHVTQKIAQIEVAQNFFRYLGLTPPQATATHIRELLESLIRVNTEIDANARHAPLTWPNDLGGTIEAIFDPLAPADDESDPDLATSHPYRLYATFLAKEAIYLTLCLADTERFIAGLRARYPLSMPCRERDFHDARRQVYLEIPSAAAQAADEAVARLELVRHERLAREDTALAQLLEQLGGSAPDLAPLIDAERAFLPLETLLERLRVPMTREDLPEVIRQHLKTVSTFDSPPN